MARYSVKLKSSAVREIEAVEPKSARQRIVRRIAALGDDPRPHGCEKLSGHVDKYRVRQGRYRIIYSIEDAALIVMVVAIAHRREAYR